MSRHGPGLDREAAGLSGVFGIGHRAYLLAQADLQRVRVDGAEPRSRKSWTPTCASRVRR
jgi:hypothetical protein